MSFWKSASLTPLQPSDLQDSHDTDPVVTDTVVRGLLICIERSFDLNYVRTRRAHVPVVGA